MSTPRLESVPTLPSPEAEGAETDLIKRFAREFFSGKSSPAAPPESPFPSVHRESPAFLEPAPSSITLPETPEDPRAAQSEEGFGVSPRVIGGPDAPPPVHSPVLEEEKGNPRLPSGGHNPDSEETHAFGEPRNNGRFAFKREPVRREGVEAAPDFYFLAAPQPSVGLVSSRPSLSATPISAFDVAAVRRDSPVLNQEINGHPLIFLDNAATTQKPQAVIDATSRFYSRDNSNIHRAAYTLAERATAAFENGREKVRQFLGAGDKHEIVFVRGTTEGINLVAQTYGKKFIGSGDEIILTELEHHANIVPWQILADQVGAVIRVIPINDRGELILEEYVKLLNARTKIVSVAHVSNSLGTVNPVETIIQLAHAHGVPVLVDGAQSTPHLPVNVQAMDADFFVFSGHKVFGPTGIGALYGKKQWLETIPPYQGGGHMIRDVRFDKTVFQNPPEKFEAGTPDIAGVVGLGAAIDYLFQIGIPSIAAYEHSLLEYATAALDTVPGLRPIGTAVNKASVLGFVIPGVSNESIAKHLDRRGIAVRAGHHCALPAVRHFGLESTVRPSLAFYNNREDVDALVRALRTLPRS